MTDGDLQPGEQTSIWRHMQGVLMGYYGAFEQHKSGVLPPADWQLARVILRSFWLVEGKGKDAAWGTMYEGGFFPQDFLDEVTRLREDALDYRERMREKGVSM